MESRTSEESWKEMEYTQLKQKRVREEQMFTSPSTGPISGNLMKHFEVLKKLFLKAESDPNTLGFLVFGSVSSGTHHEKSDVDVITISRRKKPSSGINKLEVDGIIVDSLFFSYDVLTHSIGTVPYLLYPLVNAKLLLDREGTIEPLLKKINDYFIENPEIDNEWNERYKQRQGYKMQSGCAGALQDTIIDIWNEFEKRYSGGKVKRPFFNSFYLTNTRIFSLVKRFLIRE